jgi:hypothetical protein
MLREQLLDDMADMTSLLLADCLENMDMNGIRDKNLRGFKGYCFHVFYLAL